MKVEISQTKDKYSRNANALQQIFLRASIILFVLIIFFLISAKISESLAENFLQAHFLIHITEENQFEKVVFPSKKFFAVMEFAAPVHDNYLDIGLSGSDVYRVSFHLKEKSDFIIISTVGTGDAKFLNLIPDEIAERGYDRIEITPLEGNWDYWMDGVTTLSDPNPSDYPTHQLIDFEIKKLEIEIDEKDLAQLEKKAADAYALGILLTEEADYIPASIRADGKRDQAEVRLKGDWTDHLEQGKWSFRIKMDDEAVWGMTKFSIHRPETRNGISEYLIQTFFREHGGIALRYDFVDVIINGEYIGVYALEEFFDKRLVENAYRREGPIIKVKEDYLWERRAFYSGRIEDWDFGLGSENGYMDFDVFGIDQTLENPALAGSTAYAITALNKLLVGEVAARDIFEIEAFAKFFAALDVFNSCHGNIWHNFRYYFNPVTGKMEPITFDNLPREGFCESASRRDDPLITPFFEDPDFARLYVHYLRQYLLEYNIFLEQEAANLGRIEKIFARDNIVFEDFTIHLDELHFLMSSTLDEKEFTFRLEKVTDGQLDIWINQRSYLDVRIDDVLYGGRSIKAQITDGPERVAIIHFTPPNPYGDLSQFSIVYTTLEDGKKHIQPVSYSQLEFAFYTAGHLYGSHDKAGTAEQDFIHPPFAAAIPAIAQDPAIAFGILMGDTVYQPSAVSYGNLKDTMAETGKPYYIAPGNHDLDGSELFVTNFGPVYQSFTQGENLLVILTPRNDWQLDSEQLDFLQETLQLNQDAVSNIFVFTHYLFWLDGEHFSWITPNGGPYQENRSNFWTEVKPMLETFDGNVYFIAGDVGAFPGQQAAEYERDGNMHFVASGMGGGTDDNYLVVKVFDDGSVVFELVPISPDGAEPLRELLDR